MNKHCFHCHLLHYCHKIKYCGCPVAQSVEQAPHIQRLCPCCSGPGFDSTCGPLLHVIPPLCPLFPVHSQKAQKNIKSISSPSVLVHWPKDSSPVEWPNRALTETTSLFCVVYLCLALSFSVGIWEDTTKHPATFMSFKTSVHCIFWRIVWVLMLLRCFQPAVTSATSSSSQGCTVCHNNAVEHHIWS